MNKIVVMLSNLRCAFDACIIGSVVWQGYELRLQRDLGGVNLQPKKP